jgi:hypothetical protein
MKGKKRREVGREKGKEKERKEKERDKEAEKEGEGAGEGQREREGERGGPQGAKNINQNFRRGIGCPNSFFCGPTIKISGDYWHVRMKFFFPGLQNLPRSWRRTRAC